MEKVTPPSDKAMGDAGRANPPTPEKDNYRSQKRERVKKKRKKKPLSQRLPDPCTRRGKAIKNLSSVLFPKRFRHLA